MGMICIAREHSGVASIPLHQHGATAKTFLSAYIPAANKLADVTNKDISMALKTAATVLNYPTAKGIPIKRIDTHSLRSGRANVLSLADFSDMQIQKMRRWHGATFKEYIREELTSFLEVWCTSRWIKK
jgi:hypothetical protein